jgi:hypothetical protein
MQTEKGISILAEDCQEALTRLLESVKSGTIKGNVKAVEDIKLLEGLIDKEVEYCTHQCTGECQETRECPCVNDHLCKNGVIIEQ